MRREASDLSEGWHGPAPHSLPSPGWPNDSRRSPPNFGKGKMPAPETGACDTRLASVAAGVLTTTTCSYVLIAETGSCAPSLGKAEEKQIVLVIAPISHHLLLDKGYGDAQMANEPD